MCRRPRHSRILICWPWTALRRLSELDARQAQVVELRFFGGLTLEEIATMFGVSERTVKREWQKARTFLYHALSSPGDEDDA